MHSERTIEMWETYTVDVGSLTAPSYWEVQKGWDGEYYGTFRVSLADARVVEPSLRTWGEMLASVSLPDYPSGDDVLRWRKEIVSLFRPVDVWPVERDTNKSGCYATELWIPADLVPELKIRRVR